MFSKSKNKPPVPAFAADTPPAFGSSAPPVLSVPPVAPEPRSRSSAMVQSLVSDQKPSVVSEGFVMRGDIDSAGILHVEGSVIGTLKADDINVGMAGLVEGTLTCKNLSVKGQVSGSVVCDELVVAPSAKIRGEISYLSLTIGSGASIECEMICRKDAAV